MVSIYPKVNGSVSDADIERETTAAHTADPSVPVRTRAEESDLTSDRLNWVLGAEGTQEHLRAAVLKLNKL
jgi:hypothetical protein